MGVIVEILAAVFYLVLDLWPWGSDRRHDRRLLRGGRARCGIRSVTGRVLDVGTEWSTGICTISTGRIRFTPRVGIVGDRDIEVLEVLGSDVVPDRDMDLGGIPTATYVIRTAHGDLLWVLPAHVAEQASGLLFVA